MNDSFNPVDIFSLAAIEEAIRNIELAEEEPYATELDLWLAQVTTPEYAMVLSNAVERLSRDNYDAHEGPILEALQSLDGADTPVTLMTIEGIVIEAYTSYLAKMGIFINGYIEWTANDINTLSAIGYCVRNIDEFYDPYGALQIIDECETNSEIVAILCSFIQPVTIEDSLSVIDHISDDLIDGIAVAFNTQIVDMEDDIGAFDDIIVAKREKVRKRLINFNRQYSPEFVKRYLSSDCKVGLSVGEQLTETAPLFFDILEKAGIDDVAMELAAILCLSDIDIHLLPTQLNTIIDELNIELNKVTTAKQWVINNEAFLLSLEETTDNE